tara:strand:- start:7694 stop:8341 length:648 start_codon:yes stop_codon:yes gene_type:complete
LNNPKKIFIGLVFVEVLLLALFIFSLDSSMMPLFHIGLERNVPSTFAFFQLVLVSVLLAMLYLREKNFFFMNFSWIAFYLALDELSAIHERLGLLLGEQLIGAFPNNAMVKLLEVNPRFAWLIIYVPVTAIILITVARFMLAQKKTHPKAIMLLALGIGIALLGAVGFELVEIAIRNRIVEIPYTLSTLFEEGLEMLGLNFIIFGLLTYWAGDRE